MSVNVDSIVVSDKFKHSDDGFKYFIGYQKGGIATPLCIILPQMRGYIKYIRYIKYLFFNASTGAKTCLF